MKPFRAFVILGIILLGYSCSNTPEETPVSEGNTPAISAPEQVEEHATQGEIYIAVDQALRPIIEAEIANFMGRFPKATINPIYLPGEEAIARMLQTDSIRLVISTRKLTEGETAVLRERVITPDYAEIGYESLMLVGNSGLSTKNLRVDQLKQILTGEIDNWQELNPEAPDQSIRLVFDHPQSSTLRYLRDSLLAGEPMRSDQIFSQQSTPDMLSYVSETPGALGFGSWSWLSDVDDAYVDSMRQSLQIMRLETDTAQAECKETRAFVGPYQSNIYQRCYPLTRAITSIRRESIYGMGAGFIAYMVGPQGQRIIHKSGLVAGKPIPREVRFPERPDGKDVQSE